jgi:hypothetical protein
LPDVVAVEEGGELVEVVGWSGVGDVPVGSDEIQAPARPLVEVNVHCVPAQQRFGRRTVALRQEQVVPGVADRVERRTRYPRRGT